MHYYKRNIGDYHKKAGRLSILQHGAYTLLMDACYDREKFPTLEEAIDWVWASDEAEISAVKFVLSKFFTEVDGVYVQSRIQSDLDKYHETAATNKRIALEREAKRKEKSTKRAQGVDEAPPNHKPLTTNQEPIKDKPESAKADPIPYAKISECYNSKCSRLPKMAKLSDARKTKIRIFWNKDKKHQDLNFYERYFNHANTIPFLTGENDRGWRADFDWLMNESNLLKVIEGKYNGN